MKSIAKQKEHWRLKAELAILALVICIYFIMFVTVNVKSTKAEIKRTTLELESLAGTHGGSTTVSAMSLANSYQKAKNPSPVQMGTSMGSKTYLFTGGGHWVKNRTDSGNFIQLEDGSLWQVNPIDRIMCSLWMYLEEIVVVESQNPSYPYYLINTDDKEKVEAKLVSD